MVATDIDNLFTLAQILWPPNWLLYTGLAVSFFNNVINLAVLEITGLFFSSRAEENGAYSHHGPFVLQTPF